uniref:CD247 molecule n=1 Tax=Leptobrachium leishanense TaxID=445787 RepID=A0A8C5LPH2_9ANUR
MKSKWISLSAFLISQVLVTEVQAMAFADPKLCYLLDGILFLYAVIVTAMFFKEKLSQHSSSNSEKLQAQQEDGTYNVVDRSKLNKPYEELKRRDVEKGERSKAGKDAVYSGIQMDKLNEPYSGLNIKPEVSRKEHARVVPCPGRFVAAGTPGLVLF